jgi:hypothetical protein
MTITFFTIPKPFEGHTGEIQENAIRSWKQSNPRCEIILFGDENGIFKFAADVGVKVCSVAKNNYGTPMLDSAFEWAQVEAQNKYLCYLNSDIIINQDLGDIVRRIPFEKFLGVGRRTCNGILDTEFAIDYFLFPEKLYTKLLPFAVGRAGWDNWFIYDTRRQGIPVIDLTKEITAIHQDHGYDHVKEKTGKKWEGPETDANLKLIGSRAYYWGIGDSDYSMENGIIFYKPISLTSIYRSAILNSPRFALPGLVWFAENFVKMRRTL